MSASGPGTTWTAHTPWNGDFGDAQFADPQPGFPFSLTKDGLRIELRRNADGRWQSGLLSSTNPGGAGFAQRYGYFEVRAKLPAGPGVWPAFWLDSRPPADSADPSVEIDVIEHYGKFPAAYNSTVTVWNKPSVGKPQSQMIIHAIPTGLLSSDFHRYGVKVDPEWIVFYLDRKQTWRVRTPPEHRHALTILLDLGLGAGWPIDKTPTPSFMDVQYVRAYALEPPKR